MSTPQNNSLIHTPRLANVLAAAGVIIAVAVSVLFLTLNGANHTALPPRRAAHPDNVLPLPADNSRPRGRRSPPRR